MHWSLRSPAAPDDAFLPCLQLHEANICIVVNALFNRATWVAVLIGFDCVTWCCKLQARRNIHT